MLAGIAVPEGDESLQPSPDHTSDGGVRSPDVASPDPGFLPMDATQTPAEATIIPSEPLAPASLAPNTVHAVTPNAVLSPSFEHVSTDTRPASTTYPTTASPSISTPPVSRPPQFSFEELKPEDNEVVSPEVTVASTAIVDTAASTAEVMEPDAATVSDAVHTGDSSATSVDVVAMASPSTMVKELTTDFLESALDYPPSPPAPVSAAETTTEVLTAADTTPLDATSVAFGVAHDATDPLAPSTAIEAAVGDAPPSSLSWEELVAKRAALGLSSAAVPSRRTSIDTPISSAPIIADGGETVAEARYSEAQASILELLRAQHQEFTDFAEEDAEMPAPTISHYLSEFSWDVGSMGEEDCERVVAAAPLGSFLLRMDVKEVPVDVDPRAVNWALYVSEKVWCELLVLYFSSNSPEVIAIGFFCPSPGVSAPPCISHVSIRILVGDHSGALGEVSNHNSRERVKFYVHGVQVSNARSDRRGGIEWGSGP